VSKDIWFPANGQRKMSYDLPHCSPPVKKTRHELWSPPPRHEHLKKQYVTLKTTYHISRPKRCTFFPKKCDLNSTRVLCAEGKYYFQTYKYLYIYYTSLSWDSENNHEDDFSSSDDDFMGFYDELIILWLQILVCNNPVFFQ